MYQRRERQRARRASASAQRLSAVRAPIALRVNPDVDPKTHPYISTGLKENKFGVPLAQTVDLATRAAEHPWLDLRGLACHIGSQIATPEPLLEALCHRCWR